MLLLAIVAGGCGSSKRTPTATVVTAPTGSGPIVLEIVSPAAGSTVTNPFTVDFRASGIQIAPASQGVPGAAHFHVLVDHEPVAEGTVIPSGTGIFHTTETSLELREAIGEHTITVLLGDNAHRRLRSEPIATVTFRVGEQSTPQGTAAQ